MKGLSDPRIRIFFCLYEEGMTDAEVRIHGFLFSISDEHNQSNHANSTIAKLTATSVPTVKRAIAKLESAGYLVRHGVSQNRTIRVVGPKPYSNKKWRPEKDMNAVMNDVHNSGKKGGSSSGKKDHRRSMGQIANDPGVDHQRSKPGSPAIHNSNHLQHTIGISNTDFESDFLERSVVNEDSYRQSIKSHISDILGKSSEAGEC